MDWTVHIRAVITRLGEDVTYTPSVGDPKTVRGIFLGPNQNVDLGQTAFKTAGTEFIAMSADFPDPKRNESILRAAVTYKFRDIEPDLVGGFSRISVGA